MEPVDKALENYVARHRAEFNAHAPRPELWAAIEQQLHPSLPVAARPAAPSRWSRRWQLYGLAASLAALLLAAGAGARRDLTPSPTRAAPAGSDPASDTARLGTAVRGLEGYYLHLLAQRRAHLRQLAPADTDEWAGQLTGLDSGYQQLRRALPRSAQPAAVLAALNQNLQTRLAVLDQQLRQYGVAGAGGSFWAVENRRMAPPDSGQ